MKEKATGWKLPLLFCCAILCFAAIANHFIPDKPDLPPLPQTLVDQAKSTVILLDTPENKEWHDRIVDAASGFAERQSKDAKLGFIVGQALQTQRLDMACAALVQIHGSKEAAAARSKIFDHALQNCDNLHWALFSIKAEPSQKQAEKMAGILTSKWEECHQKRP